MTSSVRMAAKIKIANYSYFSTPPGHQVGSCDYSTCLAKLAVALYKEGHLRERKTILETSSCTFLFLLYELSHYKSCKTNPL